MARIWKFGSDVDTDQIVPGRYAPYMRPNEDVGGAAFIEARPEFAQSCKPGDIIVALSNFGCGSSREYAATALIRRQVGAIIAESFARIFYRNALNLGLPLIVSPEAARGLKDGEEVEFDLASGKITTTGRVYQLPEMPLFAQEILREGGIVHYVRKFGKFPGQ